MVYAAYVHHSVGLNVASRQLLASILAHGELHGCQFLVGADFQVDPACVQEALWSAGACVVALGPSTPAWLTSS